MIDSLPQLGIIGGAGTLGGALARRWSAAGYRIVIGSRDANKAAAAASELSAATGGRVTGAANREAAAQSDIIVITVPWSAQAHTVAEIRDAVQGKIVIDATVPLVPPKVMRVQLPEEGSAALRAQHLLGTGVLLASAFHNVAAHKLATDEVVECDVLVFGDQKEVRESVITLVAAAGLRGLHGGALANSAAAEALTSVLIFLNRTYDVDGAGIRITGNLQIKTP